MTYSEALYLEIMKFQVLYPNIDDPQELYSSNSSNSRTAQRRYKAFLELVKEYTLPMVDDAYRSVTSPNINVVDYPESQDLTPLQEKGIFESVLKNKYLKAYRLILRYPSVKTLYPEKLRQAIDEVHASQK